MPEPSQIPMPEPSQIAMSEPSQIVMSEPSQTAMPEPSQTAMPEPSQIPMPEPSQIVMSEPSQTAMPEPSQIAMPEPSQIVMPEQSQIAMPEQSQTAMPEPSETAMPEPSQIAMPEPSQIAMPEQSQIAMPEQSQTATPEPSHTAMPEPSQIAMPEQSQIAMPEPSQIAMSEQSQIAMPEQSQIAMPEQSQIAIPEPSQIAMPEPSLGKCLLFSVMFTLGLILASVTFVLGDDPIVHLFSKCPLSDADEPTLRLTADVPSYALARCRNGDKPLIAVDVVNFKLDSSFDQSSVGERCQFYKKAGIRTYTVDVEVGWGDRDTQIIQQRKIHTISCAYDAHGKAVSKTETIADWFLNPWEKQTLLGANSTATFTLKVMDVLGQEVTSEQIAIGRKVQLVAWDTTGQLNSFRALSCAAVNSVSRYYILRAGCGDGLIFPKTSGFETRGNCVYSPWFEAFKLSGGDNTVRFECTYTACNENCDGDSCAVEVEVIKPKRSVPDRRTFGILSRSFHLN